MASASPPRLPPEILFLILKHAIDDYSIPELFQTRLVNTTFAEEILAYLFQTDRLEEERFNAHRANYWTPFPKRLKRLYLHKKIDRYHERPCALSHLVHEYLDGNTGVAMLEKDRDIQIQKIVDSMILAGPGILAYLNSDLHDKLRASSPFYSQSSTYQAKQLQVALMIGAIRRGDVVDVQILLENNGALHIIWSNFFGTSPLLLVAQIGTGSIMETLLLYGDWTSAWTPDWLSPGAFKALKIAIRNGNRHLIDAWLDDSRIHQKSETFPWAAFRVAFIQLVRVGDIEMVEYLNERCGRYGNDPESMRFEAFMEAIKNSYVDIADLLCDHGNFDINQESVEYLKGPLFTALYDCDPAVRDEMVKMLLERGADPNRTYSTVSGTALQAALQQRRRRIVGLLLDHGADPNARMESNMRRKRPPLLHAARKADVAIVRQLFIHGADPRVVCRRLTIIDEARRGNILNNVLEMLVEFGWEVIFNEWLRKRQSDD
ncbi:ankyrin repeat-containing domain protein [Aspergillus aurantiobrunneus]